MQQSSSDFKYYVRNLQVLHLAMVAGVTMALFILKYLRNGQNTAPDSILLYSFIGAASIALLLYFTMYSKKIDTAKTFKGTMTEKLAKYKEAFIFKLATIEGPAMIGAILHFLDGNPILFYSSLALIILLFLQRPTEEKIVEELGLKF